jgi:hypothetical protein
VRSGGLAWLIVAVDPPMVFDVNKEPAVKLSFVALFALLIRRP